MPSASGTKVKKISGYLTNENIPINFRKEKHTRGGKDNRTYRATRISLELKASTPSRWHIKDSLSEDVENFERWGLYTAL